MPRVFCVSNEAGCVLATAQRVFVKIMAPRTYLNPEQLTFSGTYNHNNVPETSKPFRVHLGHRLPAKCSL